MSGFATSKISARAQTVLPRAVRERLGVGPGDQLAYVLRGQDVILEKLAARAPDDPFDAFDEWSSDQDEQAFSDL